MRKQTLSGFFNILHHNFTGVISAHGISLPDDFAALAQACRFWGRLKFTLKWLSECDAIKERGLAATGKMEVSGCNQMPSNVGITCDFERKQTT